MMNLQMTTAVGNALVKPLFRCYDPQKTFHFDAGCSERLGPIIGKILSSVPKLTFCLLRESSARVGILKKYFTF